MRALAGRSSTGSTATLLICSVAAAALVQVVTISAVGADVVVGNGSLCCSSCIYVVLKVHGICTHEGHRQGKVEELI